jgi:aspartate aminotransferase-like enzyme
VTASAARAGQTEPRIVADDHGPAPDGRADRLVFKIATEPWELEQIYRLNYRTFVEEIPQHPVNADSTLVDKFDAENTYIVCLDERRLVGMIAVRDRRPFSLDHKLPNLDAHLPPARNLCEFRLLSVLPAYRTGRVFLGLVVEVARYCLDRGYDLALISGTTRQQKLYRHIGFVPFGPLVGEPGAQFQPMYLTPEHAVRHTFSFLPDEIRRQALAEWDAAGQEPGAPNGQAPNGQAPATEPDGRTEPYPAAAREPVNLLPGPVAIPLEVQAALAEPPLSHRAEAFVAAIAAVKRRLRDLVRAERVEILMGSGTLANDAVAGQLSLLDGRGLVLANGEFGDRLLDHATRWGLAFDPVRVDWGEPLPREAVEQALRAEPAATWLWVVHCETSTGVLNDLPLLKEVAAAGGVRLCLDCISSIGTVPVDLAGVYLASGVSGKGLAAFPGLSMVFADHAFVSAPAKLPRYLDLGVYAAGDGVPFTMSSNLLTALDRALDRALGPVHFARVAELSTWLRAELEALGFRIVAPPAHAAPAVLTIALPPELGSNRVGAELRAAGYLLSYQSRYLLERNWVQVCLMGEWEREQLVPLLTLLRQVAPSPS